jgi:toxin ParE1/3/4
MKLRFTRQSLRDLEEIATYLRERNPTAASRVRTSILEALKDLTDFPELGRLQSAEGVRKYVTRGYSYLVYSAHLYFFRRNSNSFRNFSSGVPFRTMPDYR